VQSVYARTFSRAAEIIGSEEELARYLKVTPSHLALWITGTGSPPVDAFLKAVDVITDADIHSILRKQAAP
jgi:DNA-binding transcriptional regulator YdaS (Cro superfamily)